MDDYGSQQGYIEYAEKRANSYKYTPRNTEGSSSIRLAKRDLETGITQLEFKNPLPAFECRAIS